MKIYIVQSGDTLYQIAQKHGVSLNDLKAVNKQLDNPDQLTPGMKIKVPSGAKAVKKKEMPIKEFFAKKEKPVKKEMKKEMPIKKEAKKEVKKEMPVKKEVKKEAPVKKEKPKVEKKPVKKEIAKPKAAKPIEKKAAKPKAGISLEMKFKPEKAKQKMKAKPEMKPEAETKWTYKNTNQPAPVNPSEKQKPAAVPMKEPSKQKPISAEYPMMEEAYPDMMGPAKSHSQKPAYQESESYGKGHSATAWPLQPQGMDSGPAGSWQQPGYFPQQQMTPFVQGSGGYGPPPSWQQEMPGYMQQQTESAHYPEYSGQQAPQMQMPQYYPKYPQTESYGGQQWPGTPYAVHPFSYFGQQALPVQGAYQGCSECAQAPVYYRNPYEWEQWHLNNSGLANEAYWTPYQAPFPEKK